MDHKCNGYRKVPTDHTDNIVAHTSPAPHCTHMVSYRYMLFDIWSRRKRKRSCLNCGHATDHPSLLLVAEAYVSTEVRRDNYRTCSVFLPRHMNLSILDVTVSV